MTAADRTLLSGDDPSGHLFIGRISLEQADLRG
jgi:hypothetical protein